MTTATQELIEVNPISTSSAKEFNDEAQSLAKQVSDLKIQNQADYDRSAGLLSSIKGLTNKAEVARKKITTPLDQAKAAVMDLFRPTATALENLEKHLKSLMIAYTNEQERIRREEEDRLRRKAEAEEARQRKIKEEQERQWREKQEAARKEAERLEAEIAKSKNAKAKAEAEERAAIARAEQAKAAAKAEERRQQAAEVYVPAPVIASTVTKPQGVSIKKNWKARVINIALVPREYMIVDVQKLDQIAKATKGSLNLAGIQFYAEDVLASR